MSFAFDIICLALTIVFFWSTFVVLIGLLVPGRKHPYKGPRIRFAVLVCARNEERVIKLPVKGVMMSKYPVGLRDVIVLADNCTDRTAEIAREAGAIVWEKTTPSHGKGDVLAWGIEKIVADGNYDAIAVFDADNVMSDNWLDTVNSALLDGETVVTGRRHCSNAKTNTITGWYTVYWDMMNELSNRVRTNLRLSGKLTGTGFAFLISALPPEGWKTLTMVEDVEFTVQHNLRGGRVAYLPDADYADEQPETVYSMWRQLRRWATGGWQVVFHYVGVWLKGMVIHPSPRLFDSFFAIITGISVAFIHLFNVVAFFWKLFAGVPFCQASTFFLGVLMFILLMGWVTGFGAIALSQKKRSPSWFAVVTFPLFSLVLSASVLYTLVFPTRRWKPIEHKGAYVAQ